MLVLILLGIFFLGNSGTYFAGLQYLDASLSALIVYMYPAIVAVLTIRFGRRLEGRRAWGALALATSASCWRSAASTRASPSSRSASC